MDFGSELTDQVVRHAAGIFLGLVHSDGPSHLPPTLEGLLKESLHPYFVAEMDLHIQQLNAAKGERHEASISSAEISVRAKLSLSRHRSTNQVWYHSKRTKSRATKLPPPQGSREHRAMDIRGNHQRLYCRMRTAMIMGRLRAITPRSWLTIAAQNGCLHDGTRRELLYPIFPFLKPLMRVFSGLELMVIEP